MKRLRRGMTVLERQHLREEIMQVFLDKARQQASEAGLSLACRQAMLRTGPQAQALHGACSQEEPGGSGCLCRCHDDNRGGVVAGTAVEMGPDAGQLP